MQRRDLVGAGLLAAVRPGWAAGLQVHRADLVVVGSGAAGLTAAVRAAQCGLRRVVVLEKAPVIGGHTMLSTGYVSAVLRGKHTEEAYERACTRMLETMARTAAGRGQAHLAAKLVRESDAAVQWLRTLGVAFAPSVYQTLGGLLPLAYVSSSVRAGYDYITALNKAARSLGVQVAFEMRAERILVDSAGAVRGLEVQGPDGLHRFEAPAVVLATGGFGANVALRTRFDARLEASFPTTTDPGRRGTDPCTGDAVRMTEPLGAACVDMDCIQIIPFWGGRLTDYVGADIFLDGHGRRFVNEADTWHTIAEAILQLPGKRCWVLTDSQSVQGASRSSKILAGVVRVADSLREVAVGMGVSIDVLTETVARYNAFVRQGKDDDFGKTMFTQQINKPPFFYGAERLYVHYCCGGLKIDDKARVLTTESVPIAGLFAAGEVTGGIHGEDRLGGCAMTDCFVFGRQAGLSAAHYVREQKASLDS